MIQPNCKTKMPGPHNGESFRRKIWMELEISGFLFKGPLIALMLIICSCSGSQNRQDNENQQPDVTTEDLIEANRNLVKREQEKIREYVNEQNMEMEKTGTGMWYKISDAGKGDLIQTGDVVTLEFSVHLLDGTLCYDSENKGPKSFEVGKGDVESGLQQGVLMLKEGAKAKFIMPPHLAHGLVGDDDQIPSRAIIIYDLEVLDVEKSE